MKKTLFLGLGLAAVLWSTSPACAAHISGSLTLGAASVDLTAEGTDDWALWGYGSGGTSTSLTPDVRKAGGSDISFLLYIDSNTQPLRGLGQFAIGPAFSWTDGDTTVSATGAHGGLQANTGAGPGLGVGQGFTLAVPAEFFEQEVKIYVGQHQGVGRLTASLSDGSAADYVDSSLTSGVNAVGCYTIQFSAASAGQLLNIDWEETSATSTFDNPAIYAATLRAIPEPSVPTLFGMAVITAAGVARFRRKA